jgi:hypothetical protein
MVLLRQLTQPLETDRTIEYLAVKESQCKRLTAVRDSFNLMWLPHTQMAEPLMENTWMVDHDVFQPRVGDDGSNTRTLSRTTCVPKDPSWCFLDSRAGATIINALAANPK